ncbi:MAG: FAD-dependent oxidoreductase, partial [Verrucomicrobiota bacterium]
MGGHRFFSRNAYVNQIWKDILGDDFLIRPRLSRIRYRGRMFDYPLRPLNVLMGLGLWETVRVILSYLKVKLFPRTHVVHFEDWVANRFGQRLFDIFFKTYTEKVWGCSCREISADWAAQRIRNLSLKKAVIDALRNYEGRSRESDVTTLIRSFFYPRLGPGMMWERCVEGLVEKGCELETGYCVTTLIHREGRVERVCAVSGEGDRLEIPVEQVISTMPLTQLVASLEPSAPAEVVDAAGRLRYRDYLTVVLLIDRADVFPDNWIYIHEPEVQVGRIQNYKNWSPEMVPDPTSTSLGLEYFLWENDEEWSWSDQRLVERGIEECVRLGLIEAGEVTGGKVLRVPMAYPIYDD